MPSVEGHFVAHSDDQAACGNYNQVFYSWMVEECILAAYGSKTVSCPTHSEIPLLHVAPDVVSIFL